MRLCTDMEQNVWHIKILYSVVAGKVNRMSIKDVEQNGRDSELERQGTVNFMSWMCEAKSKGKGER